ncbi:MAG: hypothetical protein V2A56_11840 [bacterium]
MDFYRRFIESAATLLNMLLGTRLLWPPRPNGFRARLRRVVIRIRQNPDLLIDWIYALRYPLAAFTTLFSAAVVGFAFIEMNDTPGTLTGKLAGAAFVAGIGVLTVGAGRAARTAVAKWRVHSGLKQFPDDAASYRSNAGELSLIRKLSRHAYLLHLMLLFGSGGLLLLGMIGFGFELVRRILAYHPQASSLALSILLILQGTVTLFPILHRIRR